MDTRISAILTTFRRPELAKRALQSILAQTLVPSQILIVEDGSETGLEEWVAQLGRDNLQYVRHGDNRGLAAARNTGLNLARNEFVAYLDDDDIWLPTRLEEQLRCWQALAPDVRETVAAIQVGCRIVGEDEEPLGSSMPINRGRLRDSIIENGAGTPSSCFLFVRSALLAIGGFDEELISGVDHDVWMKLAVAGYASEFVAKPLVLVHKDARQTMMSDTTQRIAGIEQYVRKWRPTYRDWFGSAGGETYAKRYAIRVISRLAGEKLAAWRFREGLVACRAVLEWTHYEPGLLVFASASLVRFALILIMQRLRTSMRALIHRRA